MNRLGRFKLCASAESQLYLARVRMRTLRKDDFGREVIGPPSPLIGSHNIHELSSGGMGLIGEHAENNSLLQNRLPDARLQVVARGHVTLVVRDAAGEKERGGEQRSESA